MNKQNLWACFNEQLYFFTGPYQTNKKKTWLLGQLADNTELLITNYGMYIGRDLGHL